MRQRVAWAGLLCVVLAGCNRGETPGTAGPATAPPAVSEFSADMTMSADGKATNGKMYASKGRVRTEMAGAVAILDTNQQLGWIIFASKQYTEIKLGQPLPKPKPVELPKLPPGSGLRTFVETRKVAPLFPVELGKPVLASEQADPCAGEAEKTCRKVGSETVNGREADKWEVRRTGEAEPGYLWVDKRLRMVVRRQSGDSLFELKNIQEGPQDGPLFTVPKEYEKISPAGG